MQSALKLVSIICLCKLPNKSIYLLKQIFYAQDDDTGNAVKVTKTSTCLNLVIMAYPRNVLPLVQEISNF